MTVNKPKEELIFEKKLKDTLSYFRSLLFDSAPSVLPDSISNIPEVQTVAEVINDIRNALFLAKNGDFSYTAKGKGFIIGTLKALQANLNHIAWIARQVADGDLEQRMSYMGEFSSAFNSMTEQLANVLHELHEQRDHYSHLALHDPLTGLKNRAYFNEQIANEIARAKRKDSLLAVLVIDLDKFKQVNDTMGHHAGDILLIEFANRLSNSTREMDTVARVGGDEFGLLLPCDTNSRQNLIKMSERILSHICAYFELDGSEYKTSASIGVSIYPLDGNNPQTLIETADRAMYQAKKIDGASCIFMSLDKLNP
ncbi:MAG: GGDEF domain-containing protein [Synergistaceae bacterium]|nr:GGDEF domain-containing protein [Synergistaceae bacterium]